MKNFEDIEELVDTMFKIAYLHEENICTAIVDYDIAKQIIDSVFSNHKFNIGTIDMSQFEYDKEYMCSISYDGNEFTFDIFQGYIYDKDIYLSTDGYVLFEESVPSKCLTDMRNNENTEFDYDIFTIGECDCCCESDDDYTYIPTDENGTHGFTQSWSDEKGFHSRSFYSSDVDMVQAMLKAWEILP